MKDKPTFAEIIYDAKFEVVGVGDMPKGEHFWCAFCGGRGVTFVLLKRLNDNTTWKVGRTCIGRVGLTLPKSAKKVVIKREEKKPVKVAEKKTTLKPKEKKTEKPKKEEVEEPKVEKLKKEEVSADLADLFEDLD